MFSENEVAMLLYRNEVRELVRDIHVEFVQREAPYMDLSLHDFLSLVLLTPCAGVALANGKVSLMEELALGRLGRRMSEGGYIITQDPVVHTMVQLIPRFSIWEARFLGIIREILQRTLDLEMIRKIRPAEISDPVMRFASVVLLVPHILVRVLSSFVLNENSDLCERRRISKVEHNKIASLGKELNLSELPVFTSFLQTFDVK